MSRHRLVVMTALLGCDPGALEVGSSSDGDSAPAMPMDGSIGENPTPDAQPREDLADLVEQDQATEPAPDAESPEASADAASPNPDAATVVDEGCVRVRVADTGGIGLNVRPDPSTGQAPVGNLPDGAVANVLSRVNGEAIDGNPLWFEIERGPLRGFVTAVFAECLGPPEPGLPTDDLFLLPFRCDETYTVTQGNNSNFSHNGDYSAFAFDFSMPLRTPMLATRRGQVSHAYGGTQPGDPCYEGGGRGCINEANYVVISHEDGTSTLYAHLSHVSVGVGEDVSQGQEVGATGTTGWSTGPHAHVVREESCGRAFCNSVAMAFADVPDDGVPAEGDRVTSQNGCGR